ncbi:MAG: SDR family oxidoreductase [Candidatus Saccharimonadales bacterium]
MNIILGGTHGLGWEIACLMRKVGNECYIIGRSYDSAKHGKGARVDLANREAVENFIFKLDSLFVENEIESFIWSAGVGYQGDFELQQDVATTVDINVTNSLLIAQKVWQKMCQQDSGKFVVISSSTGTKARDNEAVYALTKHAQVGFARSLGLEAERLNCGVFVSLVLPGGMKTPFWDGHKPEGYETYNDPQKVAQIIIDEISRVNDTYHEYSIDRGAAA